MSQNKDIGFVEAGQQAIVKIESFPFTRYGVLGAQVTRVAQDAIPEPDAQTGRGQSGEDHEIELFRRRAAHAEPGVSGDLDA